MPTKNLFNLTLKTYTLYELYYFLILLQNLQSIYYTLLYINWLGHL
jgi:hypothetical protein